VPKESKLLFNEFNVIPVAKLVKSREVSLEVSRSSKKRGWSLAKTNEKYIVERITIILQVNTTKTFHLLITFHPIGCAY
jgi:hypothetical protein